MNKIEAIRNKLFKILAMVMPLKLSFCLSAHLTTLESAASTFHSMSKGAKICVNPIIITALTSHQQAGR
jgi:hypothetical protein